MSDFVVSPLCPAIPPLTRRRGLSWSTSEWGMTNFRGKNAINTVQPENRTFKNAFGGFRLARDTITEEP